MKRTDWEDNELVANTGDGLPRVAAQSDRAREEIGDSAGTPKGRAADSNYVEDRGLTEILRLVAHAPSRMPQPLPTPGQRWGVSSRYLIDRRVGSGGMGTVYAATDTL